MSGPVYLSACALVTSAVARSFPLWLIDVRSVTCNTLIRFVVVAVAVVSGCLYWLLVTSLPSELPLLFLPLLVRPPPFTN